MIVLAVPASGLSRIWEADLARPSDFLPQGAGPGDTSLLPYPTGDWHVLYSASMDWNGLMRREGAVSGEIASGRAAQSVWIRPVPMLAVALTWTQSLERNRYAEPGKLEASLGERRIGRGLAAVYRLMPGIGTVPGADAGAQAPEDRFLDLALSIPDVDRQGYAWSLALGRRGHWRAEYSLERRDVDEPFTVANLDSNGGGERVAGAYRARVLSHRLSGTAPFAGGSLSLSGAYGEGKPHRPEREFWFTDSSRRIDGAIRYARLFGRGGRGGGSGSDGSEGRDGSGGGPAARAWGEWNLHAAYREAEIITLGRRIPPGSEGMKRFHYARNHGRILEAGVGREPAPGEPGVSGAFREGAPYGLSLGAVYRDYDWSSSPSPDALDERSETLSYNRLGLSFVANLYGGLFKESEIISGSFRAGIWETHGDWRFGFRRLSATAGLSLYRTDFRFRWEGRSLSQRLFTVDTSAAYGDERSGYLIGATPRLGLALSLGHFKLAGSASQVVPLVLETGGGGSGAAGGGSNVRYPPFRNGFVSEVRLEAGY